MSRFGTDFLAVACILGGGAVGGVMTMAFLGRGHDARADCAAGAMTLGSRIVVTSGVGSRAVVLSTPHLEMHSSHDCLAVMPGEMTFHIEEVRRAVEASRVDVDVARLQMQQAMEKMVQLRKATAGADHEARLEDLQLLIERMEKGSGGQLD